MGLINLRTNLKSLRFGNDTQGGGASGLPYIQTGLPEDSPSGEYLASIARNSADWPLRGGQYWTVASTEDAVRVSRFLTDFPKGTTFTTKQVQLQKSNPKIETGGLASRLNTQTYNLNANLLAQVLEQGSGIHIPRAGANTNELGPDNPQAKYEYIVSNKDTNQNRLVTLYNTKISTDTAGLSLDATVTKLGISAFDDNLLFDYVGGPDSLYGDGNTTIFRTTNTNSSITIPDSSTKYLNTLGLSDYIKTNSIEGLTGNLFPYRFRAQTLPSSVTTPSPSLPQLPNFSSVRGNLDFTKTEFGNYPKNLYQQSNKDFIRPEQTPTEFEGTINQFNNTMGYSALLASKGNDLLAQPKLQDFRQKAINPSTLASDYSDPSSSIVIEKRLQLGDPGARTRAQRNYINQVNNGVGQDKINLLPLYKSSDDPIQTNSVRDMIKFCIEVIDNDNSNSTVPLHFRAYITDLSDNIGAEWNSQRYMGRGESFYSYQGFTREVSFKLVVAAQSKQEMMPLYQKLNYLASSLMPDYSSNGFMRGNLHKLTVGEWFYRTPGVLKSMNISIDNNYPWEIKFTEPETRTFGADNFQKKVDEKQHKDKANRAEGSSDFQNSNSDADMMELPQILSINFTFTPILNNLPRLAKEGGLFTQTPILISDHGDNENFIKRIVN
jgi:hypothetical protein